MNKYFQLILCALALCWPAGATAGSGHVVSWGMQVIPDVQLGTKYKAIAAGNENSLAVGADGTVVAWGNNFWGQCAVPTNLSGMVAVATRGDNNMTTGGQGLALKADGTVVGWGWSWTGSDFLASSVPVDLSGVTAIAVGGAGHCLALKSDRTVVAWGNNLWGQASVPANLIDVIAISAGAYHSLALKSDGTVVQWGHDGWGQMTVPTNLTGVTAISAGFIFSLALKSDGTVVAWGYTGDGNQNTAVPTNLTSVTAISAGVYHSLALKADGTVVAWGKGNISDTNVPLNINGVVAISAGTYHNLALKADGTLISWGRDSLGEATVPGSLSNVTGIAEGGGGNSLALKADGTVVALNGHSAGPTNLSGVIAIANGASHSLALKSDGKVIAWGANPLGQTNVPTTLSGVVAIAAGTSHSLALKSDGTVVAWGDNSSGQAIVPTDLGGVIAIGAGDRHSLALKSDGKVIAWGANPLGQTNVPTTLSGVIAIAAGVSHNLALKSDGTVVAWGDDSSGQATVPTNLGGVIAIAAGLSNSLALKSDGSVVAWGHLVTVMEVVMGVPPIATVTPNVGGVIDIAAGWYECLALRLDGPWGDVQIRRHPFVPPVLGGTRVILSVAAVGAGQLHYQWQFNGQNLAGATGATLTLNAVGAGNAGSYSVVVWNAYGTNTSASAQLVVLGVTASQQSPVQITTLAPIKLPGKNNLVLVTHGWIKKENNFIPFLPPPTIEPWVINLASNIQTHAASDWQAVAFDWALDAWTFTPDGALDNAIVKGDILGKQIAAQHWQHIHLIAHSAGSALIQRVADIVRSNSPGTTIHTTFLDPYLGLSYSGLQKYGRNADWSDNYFAHDLATDDLGDLILHPNLTGGQLLNSHNVDVGWLDPKRLERTHTTILNILTGQRADTHEVFSSHGWPYGFYSNSVAGTAGVCAANFGFPLSKEGGGWLSHATFPINNDPNPLCGYPAVTIYTPPPKNFFPVAQFSGLPKMTSGSHVDIFSEQAFKFFTYLTQPIIIPHGGGIHPNGGSVSTNAVSAWLEVALMITNQINYLQFEAGFDDTNAAEGLLSVYWETNQIGLVDERVAGTGMQTYQFALPKTVASGIAILSFRLDSFNGTTSSMVVSNVATGYIGITEPLTLGISLTNQTPLLQLTGASNYNYLVQSSTNLVNWSPMAYLPNTNGTVLFFDEPVTNSPARFYRAVMP